MKKELFTLKGVDFKGIVQYPRMSLFEKETTFLCGASGSGKSTLLMLLNGVISADKGKITYLDRSIESYDPIALRKEVLLVSQCIYLFDKTIRENFGDYYEYRGMKMPTERAMVECLSLCCVDFPLDSLCVNLSGGERQRIYIAIFLSFLPRVLMLDEPTSALDEENALALMQNLKEFCYENEMSMLVVSHHQALAQRFADRIIQLSGRGSV